MNLRSLQDKVSARINSTDIVQSLEQGGFTIDQYRSIWPTSIAMLCTARRSLP